MKCGLVGCENDAIPGISYCVECQPPAASSDFDDWFDEYERDGGDLLLYNTIDLRAAFEAGKASERGKWERARREEEPTLF